METRDSRRTPDGEMQLSSETGVAGSRDELGLEDLIRFVWRQKWIVIGTTFVVTLAAVILALTSTPIYRSRAVLAPVGDSGGVSSFASQFSTLAAFAGFNLAGGGIKEEALGILRSHALLVRFIEENDILPILYSETWDANTKTWRLEREEDRPTVWRAAVRFDEKIRTVSQDPVSGLVTLQIEWTDPELAAEWARKLTDLTNLIVQKRSIEEARRSIQFLELELAKTDVVQVQQAIHNVIEGQTKALALAAARKDFAFRVVDPPAVPEKPVRPRKRMMVAVGVILGGMLGVLLAMLRVLVRRAFSRTLE